MTAEVEVRNMYPCIPLEEIIIHDNQGDGVIDLRATPGHPLPQPVGRQAFWTPRTERQFGSIGAKCTLALWVKIPTPPGSFLAEPGHPIPSSQGMGIDYYPIQGRSCGRGKFKKLSCARDVCIAADDRSCYIVCFGFKEASLE